MPIMEIIELQTLSSCHRQGIDTGNIKLMCMANFGNVSM